MATISERLKQIMELRGLKPADLVKQTGINKGALSCYLKGKYAPKQNNIYLLAKALNVSEPWLMGADVPMERISPSEKSHSVRIPVLGRVAAGIPLNAIEEIIDYEEIPEHLARDGEYFSLRIKGDSMEPKISDGDVVICRKQEDADDGDIVIALLNGNDGCCKRLRKYMDGIALISLNPAYDPMYFSNAEINSLPVKILGKVKELRAKF